MSQFEAAFVDEHTGVQQTNTFWRGEPIIYQAPHLAKPILTHIDTIANDYFIAACSGTGRMVPRGQAQRFLQFKLSIEEVEMAVNGTELDLGERLIWRRWIDSEKQRRHRKMRVKAWCLNLFNHV